MNENFNHRNNTFIITTLILFLFFSSNGRSQISKTIKNSPVHSITIKELKEHIYFLASDSLGGRVVGTSGYQTAAKYAANEFRLSGLKTMIVDSLGNNSFLQPVPFSKRGQDNKGILFVQTPEGKFEFKGGESFKFLIFRSSDFPDFSLPVVFVGYGIEEPEAGWNDYKGLDLQGKIAVMLPGAPTRDGKPVLPKKLHDLYSGGNGDGKRMSAVFKRGPAALMLLTNRWRSQNWEKLHDQMDNVKVVYKGNALYSKKQISSRRRSSQMVIKNDILETLFKGQNYSPLKLKKDGIIGYKTSDLNETRVKFQFNMTGKNFDSWNVVAMVEGSDPKLKNHFITIGAHLDHVPPKNGQICNGADDNASGSVGVLEVAEAVAMSSPRRSVIFILYTAEELGLHGSRHFVHNFPFPLDRIKVNINLDMIGRTSDRVKETRSHNVVGSHEIHSEFKDLISVVNKRTNSWPLEFKKLTDFPGGSDHLSFLDKGIPAVFFFSGHHQDLHRPTDDPEKIEYDKMQKISQLVYELTMELANKEEPIFGN